jgi:type II secretory pathway component PulL
MAVPNVRLEAIRYGEQPRPSLQVTLVTTDFSTLEQARRKLSQAGFALAEGSSEQANGLIVNELTLTAGKR